MKQKLSAILKSILWCILITLFPICSGVISAVLSLGTVETLLLQAACMALSLLIPTILVLTRKRSLSEIGLDRFDPEGCRRTLYGLPLLLIFVPHAVRGFSVPSMGYLIGTLLLYAFVGIAEEVYFRGIVRSTLTKAFSAKGVVLWSSVIFALGHVASAFTASGAIEVALNVLNAFLFGWMAVEVAMLHKNLIPIMLVHFLFDFETKFAVISGRERLIADLIRGAILFSAAVWLAVVTVQRGRKEETE